MRRRVLLALSWVVAAAHLGGCAAYQVGLRDKLLPPVGHRLKKVRTVRKLWNHTHTVYRERALRIKGKLVTTGIYDDQSGLKEYYILMGTGLKTVHWKELLEVTGQKKRAADLYHKQRSINLTFGSVALGFALAGFTTGGILMGMGLSDQVPLDNGQVGPNLTLVISGAIAAGAGLIALFVSTWGYTGNFGVEPTKAELDKAIATYNKKLKEALGIDGKPPAYPKYPTAPDP